MCGINGILNFDESQVIKEDLVKMNNQMIFRGPDSDGFYFNNNFGMSMRRLSIIDIDNGDQPISSIDSRYHVVMNGEIYNFIELRKDLIKKGHRFETNSDTEVIIHLYKQYGINFLDYLEGMFAIAIYDKKDNNLIIARDRIGIKPLYYYYDEKILIFSSSLDSIISLNKTCKKINMNSFYSYITLSNISSPETIWQGIYKLLPAHYIQIQSKKIRINKYWDIGEYQKNDNNYEYYKNKTTSLLENSIKLHARSDVPVGTYLSGGVDSSVVTCLFSEYTAKPFHTFSIDFEDKKENESYYAELVSKKYNTIHHAYKINYQQAHQELSDIIPLMDEPIADSAIISSSFLSDRAKDFDIKVMLSGAGGDEIFGGYGRHYRNKRNLLSGILAFTRGLNLNKFLLNNNYLINFVSLLQSSPLSFATSTSGVNLGTVYNCLNDKKIFFDAIEKNHTHFSKSFDAAKKTQISDKLYVDINNYLLDNVLSLTDKTSMAKSIEARVPLLDHNLVQTAIIGTSKFCMENDKHNSKKLIKDVMKNKLPAEVLDRKKIGFNSPLNSWIGKIYKMENGDRFIPKTDFIRENFNINKINTFLNMEDKSNKYSEFLFMIYVFDNWLDSKK
jgi:asparagine synthase (glutamine-hydrolysing)